MKPAAKSPDRPDRRPRQEYRRRLHLDHSVRQGRQRRRQQLRRRPGSTGASGRMRTASAAARTRNYPQKAPVNSRQDLDAEEPQHLERLRDRPRPELRYQEHDADLPIYRTKFYAEQYNACPAQLHAAQLRLGRRSRPRSTRLIPNGGTNQPIGLAWGWQSLTQGAPLNAPAEDAELHLQEGADRDVRRSEHPGSLAVIRQRPSPVQWRHRRPPEDPVRQHQGRRHHHLHDARQHRRRSDLRRAAVLRQRLGQVLHRDLLEPDRTAFNAIGTSLSKLRVAK